MKLAGQTVAVILTEDGRQVLELAAVNLPDNDRVLVSVEGERGFGSVDSPAPPGPDALFSASMGLHLGIDLPTGIGRVVGLRS